MSMLDQIHRGRRADVADRVAIVGTEGVGKSTFASEAPSPIFLASEDGVHHLDVASINPADYAGVEAFLKDLLTSEHDFKTLVIDSVDWLEPLIWDSVCAAHNWTSIEAPGYGKGYVAATEIWRELFGMLDDLRAKRGMHIVLIAHSTVRNFSNPVGEDYSRYEVALHKSASALMKQWVDTLMFATYEELTHEQDGRAKGVATGRRVAHTERRAGWDAKSRWQIPSEITLVPGQSWASYESAKAVSTMTMKQVQKEAATLLETLGDIPDKDKVVAFFAEQAKADTQAALTLAVAGLNKLKARA